jgi:hypothetical protein
VVAGLGDKVESPSVQGHRVPLGRSRAEGLDPHPGERERSSPHEKLIVKAAWPWPTPPKGADVYFLRLAASPRTGKASHRNIDDPSQRGAHRDRRHRARPPLDFPPGRAKWRAAGAGPARGAKVARAGTSECSATAGKYPARCLDIQPQETDLIFPHHEK